MNDRSNYSIRSILYAIWKWFTIQRSVSSDNAKIKTYHFFKVIGEEYSEHIYRIMQYGEIYPSKVEERTEN